MTNFTNRILSTVILLTVISFALKAQTNVSGGIYSNTTWTKANSPYIVTDTVVVFPSVTLTIEPGVTVEFADNMRLEIRQANLVSAGTISDSITYTSNSLSPTPGIYGGLYLNGAGSFTSTFSYCNFMYASTSISDWSDIYKVFNNCNFISNTWPGNIRIKTMDSCNFINNSQGMLSYGGIISNCNFLHNGSGISGINSTLYNCIFDSNQTGLIDLEQCTINNCYIKNGQVGIKDGYNLGDGGQNTIKNCIIDSNSMVGVFLFPSENGPDSITGCLIEYNGTGIMDTPYVAAHNTIVNNVIENNNTGLRISVSYEQIYCNKICNNITYDLYYNVAFGSNGNFQNNYWCSTDSATIRSYIYDGYDNINLGLVNFMPIDTIGCYLTGCNLKITATVTNATCDTCHNGSATANVTNGTGSIIYTWQTSPIQTTQTATGLASGIYTVCVTDANGCTACNSSIFVDSTNCNGFTITSNGTNASCITCTDGKAWVDVSHGTAPYSYTWYTSPIQNTDTAFNLLHGAYNVCVTDLYGCTACDSVTIGTGACSAHFELYPDTSVLHHYIAVNMASGAGTLSYDWNWGDGSADDHTPFPSHTYAVAGFYTICLTITDTAGCTNTYCNSFYLLRTTNTMIYVTVVSTLPTSINESSANSSFYIYPNPASNHLTLLLPEHVSKGTIKVFNLLGELMSSSAIAKQETDVDVSHLASGIYIIEVFCGNTIMRQKFIRE